MKFDSGAVIEIRGDNIVIEDSAILQEVRDAYYPSDVYCEEVLIEDVVDKVPLPRIIQEIGDEADILSYLSDGAVEEEFHDRALDAVTDHYKADKWAERVDEALPYLQDEQIDDLLSKLLKEQHRRFVHEMKMKKESA